MNEIRKLINILLSLGAKHIVFPAATVTAISKVIDKIAQKEKIHALLRNKQVFHSSQMVGWCRCYSRADECIYHIHPL